MYEQKVSFPKAYCDEIPEAHRYADGSNTHRRFSEVLSIPYTQLNEILNGKRPVTTDFALMMEAALGINPEMLINMQTRYNMSVARQKKPLLTRLLDIKRACAAIF